MSDIKEKDNELNKDSTNDLNEEDNKEIEKENDSSDFKIILPEDLKPMENEEKEEELQENEANNIEQINENVIEGLAEEEKEQPLEKKLNLQMYELELKIEECDVKVEELEVKLYADPENDEAQTEYLEVTEQLKALHKEKKKLQKQINSLDDSHLNKVPIWVFIFGVLMIIISFPPISAPIWLEFSDFIIESLLEAFANLDANDFGFKVVIFLVIFAFPLIVNIITWLLHNNCLKNKDSKRAFDIMWIIQGVMSLGMIIYMCTKLYA